MSRFFSQKYSSLVPYTPGEQPRNRKFIKLNTNESPFPPSEKVIKAASSEAEQLRLYSDPESTALIAKLAETYGVGCENVIAVNGSDEVLNFAFMAFGDRGFAFPDISYGFYQVIADVNNIEAQKIPLNEDFTVNIEDYFNIGRSIVIPNPNAPTGILLTLDEIEKVIVSNPNDVVVIDEAYIDFGGESAIGLTKKYENLLVTRTYSKSFSLAGGRLGFGIGSEALINDLNTIRNSINPYNVNRMTQAAGIAALEDIDYYMQNAAAIARIREDSIAALRLRGFSCTESRANFIFCRPNFISGDELYSKLREKGILVRHWNAARIWDYCRITVGSEEQMKQLIEAIDEIKAETEK